MKNNNSKINNSKIKITDQMIDEILYKLKIISHLKKGDKLYCFDDNIYIDNSYIPSISRYINNQNRNDSILFINNCIENVIYITDFIYRNEISVKKNIKEKDARNINNFFKEPNDKILRAGASAPIKYFIDRIVIIGKVTIVNKLITAV